MKHPVHFPFSFRVLLVSAGLFYIALTHAYAQGNLVLKLVKDINTLGKTLTYPDYSEWTNVGGDLYFVAKGKQLWRIRPMDQTGIMLKELDSIYNLSNVNGVLHFAADDGRHGNEPWKTDGTENGTLMIRDIRPGITGSDPSRFTYENEQAFFSASDGAHGRELWRSDGTRQGTLLVKDVMPAARGSNPSNLVGMNGLLYFVANDGLHGDEIWMTDGSAAQTRLLKDIRPRKVSSHPRNLIHAGGKLFFGALDRYMRRRLWVSDGTAGGTKIVADIDAHTMVRRARPVDYMTEPMQLTDVNGVLFFTAKDRAHGVELWKSDGTAAGTQLVKDIVPGPRSPKFLHYLKGYQDKLYFVATADYNLWISDGTESGTGILTNRNQIRLHRNPDITGYNGLAYFLATPATDPTRVYIFSVGSAGESLTPLISDTSGYHGLAHLTASGDYLFYVRNGDLWRTAFGRHERVGLLHDNTPDSNPENITVVNGMLYFGAYDGFTFGLWKSDGTTSGTSLIHRFESAIQYLTRSGSYLYYIANSTDPDSVPPNDKLWRTNLINDETIQVSDINKHGGDYIRSYADVEGTIFISIEVPMIAGQEFPREAQLWKTTGTPESMQFIRSFNQEAQPPEFLTNVNGTLFFSAITDREVGAELWKSDGTADGTRIVKKINPDPLTGSMPAALVNANNTLFFSAYTGQDELWRSDGTEAGTFRIAATTPRGLTVFNDTLYFQSGNQLWKSDGTEAGTFVLVPFALPDQVRIEEMALLGKVGKDLLVATSYVDMMTMSRSADLWKTDGTPEGLQVVTSPVDNLIRFQDITRRDNLIYFTGLVHGTQQTQLWRTDGTTCGTFPVLTSGSPTNLALRNGTIYLASTDGQLGRELFLLDESAITAPCAADIVYTSEDQEGFRLTAVANYPNPFLISFVVRVDGPDNASYSASISDFSGNIRESHRQLRYNEEYKLGTQLPAGIYLLKVVTQNNVAVTRVVKR